MDGKNINLVKRVSIIVPTYCRSDSIIVTLNSIPKCKWIDIVVVDDNGLGTSAQIATEKNIQHLISSGIVNYIPLTFNSGACAARNKGAENAKASILSFIDDDDLIIGDEFINKLIFFEYKKEYEFCGSHTLIDVGGRLMNKKDGCFLSLSPLQFLETGNCITSMIMVRKDTFLKIGGFSEAKKYQDHIFMIKIYLNDIRICCFGKHTSIYKISKKDCITNRSDVSFPLARIDYENRLIKKNKYSESELRKVRLRQSMIFMNEVELVNFRGFMFFLINSFVLSRSISDFINVFKIALIKFIPFDVRFFIKSSLYRWL
jgi:glycosyltransferase involved in cell wall biosynthesis